jgi:hypothetical protein
MPLRTASAWMLHALLPMTAAMLTLLAVPAVASVSAVDAPQGCLNPAHVRGWSLLPDDHVLVDAGKRRFLIELSQTCAGLDHNPFLGFISHRPDSRVCGQRGDQLVPHGSAAGRRPPCPIQRVRLLDDAEYANELERRVQNNGIGS